MARADLGIPNSFDFMAMIAIGKSGKGKSPTNMQEKGGPNGRKPLRKIVMEGRFTEK